MYSVTVQGPWQRGLSSMRWLALALAACAAPPDSAFVTTQEDLGAADPSRLVSAESCGALLEFLQAQLVEQVEARAARARIPPVNVFGVAAQALERPALGQRAPKPGDLIAAEGERLYQLRGSRLDVLRATPAATEVLTSLELEGELLSVFVRNGQVLVLSRAFYLPGIDADIILKLTLVDVPTGAEPVASVLREIYLEGDAYDPAVLDGSVVRVPLQHVPKADIGYPSISYVDLFGRPREQAEIDRQVDDWVMLSTESIAASMIEDYVPLIHERVGGVLGPLPVDCGSVFLPGAPSTQPLWSGISSFDLEQPSAAVAEVVMLGYSSAAYLGSSVAVLRQEDELGDDDPFSVETHLHRFTFEGAAAKYTVTGTVEGGLYGPRWLDERGPVIRAAVARRIYTAEPVEGEPVQSRSYTRMVSLKVGRHGLREIGSSPEVTFEHSIPEIILAGAAAYGAGRGVSSRFFALDLTDPRAPALGAALELPGAVTFMLPIDRTRVLVFDREGPVPPSPTVTLRIIDVADPLQPRIAGEHAYSAESSASEPRDERAVAIDRRQSLIGFPLYTLEDDSYEVFQLTAPQGLVRVGGVVPERSESQVIECIELFGYPTDPESLATLLADTEQLEALLDECDYFLIRPYPLRGFFRGDQLVSVNSAGAAVYGLDALAGPPLSTLALPQLPIPDDG